MLGNALLLALRQIFRNPMRSILTVLGIVIGVAAVITMVTVGNGATQQVRDQIASLGSDSLMIRPGQRLGPGQSVGAPSFKESDAEALATQIAGIKAVAPSRTSTQVVVANGKNWSTSVIGTTNDYFSINNLTKRFHSQHYMLFRKIPGHLAIAGFRFHPGFFHRFVGNHQQSSCRNLVCKACRKQGCRLHIDTGSVCTAKVVFEIAVIFPYPSVRRVDYAGIIFPPMIRDGLRTGFLNAESR